VFSYCGYFHGQYTGDLNPLRIEIQIIIQPLTRSQNVPLVMRWMSRLYARMRMNTSFLHILVILQILTVVFPLATAEGQSYAREDLPPLLEFLDGRQVKTGDDWKERREEIRSLLIKHFIGTFPSETPGIANAEIVSDETREDGSRRRRIRVTWTTPNRASFEMAVWTPQAEGPFPLLLTAPRDYQQFWAEDALARGYAVCLFPGLDSHHQEGDYADYGKVWDAFRREYPKATWTEISTKGWLASRCIDYLLGDQSVVRIEPDHIAIIGFSRYGKQAMIAAASDPRITCVVARSPGSPASSPYRLTSRNTFAEAPADFPGQWFLPSLRGYLGREHELPIDAHGWYALIAPRRCLIHTAHTDGSEPTFAVEKAYLEGRSVYRFLDAEQNLRIDYRPGGHGSVGPERISNADRKRNLDWIDLSFGRGSACPEDFPEQLLHDFDWNAWRTRQAEAGLVGDRSAAVLDRLGWALGEAPKSIPKIDQPEFLTKEESDLMTHDRWAPSDVRRVPIRFGAGVRGNLYFKAGLTELIEPLPVVVWLHPFSYHSGYNEGYGVEGTTVYHRLAQNGFAVIAYDQCGFGLRLLEGTTFYDQHPRWSRLGRMVRDARDAVRFAAEGQGAAQSAIPKLDADRVFLLGYSAGALTAMYTAALEERVAGTACFSGWTPMRNGANRRLWELHALLPRLGIYQDRENELPLDYDDILPLVARRPCLLVTPKRDRFADHAAVAETIRSVQANSDNITWRATDDVNRFQSDQHKVFLDWVRDLTAASPDE
jgi:dienelactone hydrolase